MTESRKILAVVTGPTASGKTSLAIELACYFGTDVISADSRQIFKDIPIGTAAPTDEEKGRAFHYFVGVLDLDSYYSAARYEKEALEVARKCWETSDVVIVCGGSMMYIDALCYGVDEMPAIDDSTRRFVLSLKENYGLEGVLAQLKILDPDYYDFVDKSNPRRVIHGLEVCLQSGVPYTSLRKGVKKDRDFGVLKFAIDHPRTELFDRINQRVDTMFDKGLVEEARRALSKGSFNSLNTVGYKELKEYIEGRWDLETARQRIAKNTRVYAKKQLTWLARDPSIIHLEPDTAFEEAKRIIECELNGDGNYNQE